MSSASGSSASSNESPSSGLSSGESEQSSGESGLSSEESGLSSGGSGGSSGDSGQSSGGSGESSGGSGESSGQSEESSGDSGGSSGDSGQSSGESGESSGESSGGSGESSGESGDSSGESGQSSEESGLSSEESGLSSDESEESSAESEESSAESDESSETEESTNTTSSSSSTDYEFQFALNPDAVPETPSNMANRPFATLTITLVTTPPNPGFKKRVYLSSGGASGQVTFDNASPEVVSGTPFQVKVYGQTVSSEVNATKILARLDPAQPPIEEIPITVWRVIVYNGESPVNQGDYIYISADPTMPEVRTRIIPYSMSGEVGWNLLMEYLRTDRNDQNTLTSTVSAALIWNVAFGTNFYGGRFSVKGTHKGLTSDKFVFYVRGASPSEAAVAAYIDSVNPLFYAKAIAKVESGVQSNRTYLQFNLIGPIGPGWDDYRDCPNRGDDPGGTKGWGIFQLTIPKPNVQQLWNWKANVDEATARMNNHRTVAEAWMNSQESQQQAEDPSKPLENFPFTWNGVTFRKGTARTPVDACAIWRYNGHGGKWPIYWDNTNKTWKQLPSFYLDLVCGELSQ